MHYDVVIIGAGMSAFAAGIRLAYFDKHVCIVEKHSAPGGLNSYYSLGGRSFDVGLHAVTNYAPPEKRLAPLAKLLRQLRFQRDDFALCPQGYSEIRFPGRTLRFSNDLEVLTSEVAREFPGEADNFRRLLAEIDGYEDTRLDQPFKPARPVLREFFHEQRLIEMLLCPVMYYGSAQEHDMDFTQFVTIFKSLFFEGFARPRDGVRTIIRALIKKFRGCGGTVMMNSGVERIDVDNGRVTGLVLESGEQLTGDVVLSSAGYIETMQLCGEYGASAPEDELGRMSFVETIGVMDKLPQELGHEATIVFFNDADTFTYSQPTEAVDLRSGVVCCPSNYVDHEDMKEGTVRLTWMANYEKWLGMDEEAYRAAKQRYLDDFLSRASIYVPGFRDRVVCTDMFTPRTIRDYTGHINGAVYGSPRKRRDGRTPIENLYICGTDQGFLGIIGAMLSGITIANLQVLSKE